MVQLYSLILMVFGMGSFFVTAAEAQRVIPSPQQQIEAAVRAAPEPMRATAKVYGYNPEGEWMTLREGQGPLICIADDPKRSQFHVACYHHELEPFMKRGRELRSNGLTRKEVDDMRREEIASGQLPFPQKARTLYSISGEKGGYDYEAGQLRQGQPLTVIYVPYGTQETTGMTTAPAGPGASWLMEPGMPWAHIMIPGVPVDQSAE